MNRHQLSQREVDASIYLFKRVNTISHSGASFFGHLYNTFFILKNMGASEDTCLAGLYHSVYGTERFLYSTEITKEEVISMIGDKAEKLVYLFSLEDRLDNSMQSKLELDRETRLSLLQMLYANEKEQNNNGVMSMKYTEYMANLKKQIAELS